MVRFPSERVFANANFVRPACRVALPSLILVLLTLSRLVAGAEDQASSPESPDRSRAYYHYALAHLDEQRWMQHGSKKYLLNAIEQYQAAIEDDPESDYLRRKLIRLYARAGRVDEAVSNATDILQQDPENVEVRRLLGEIYLNLSVARRRGEPKESLLRQAIEQYEKIQQIDPSDKDSLLQLANLYRQTREPQKTEEALKRLLDLDPDSASATANLAFLYLDMGNTQQAIELLERLEGQGEASPNHLKALGAAYERAGEHGKASKVFEQLLEKGGNSLQNRQSLAHNLVLSGQFERALKEYQELVKVQPRNSEHHLRLSQIYRELRRFREARESLRDAEVLDPQSLEIKYNDALLLEAEGKMPEAVQSLTKLLDSTAKDSYSPREERNRAMFHEQLGMLYRTLEDYAKAEEAFRAMGEVDERAKPRSWAHLIEVSRAARRYDEAKGLAASASEEFPDNAPLARLRATVLAEIGEFEQGAKILQALLVGAAADWEIYLALAGVYEKGKRFDQAVEAIRKARELSTNERQERATLFTHGSVLERAKRFDEAQKKFEALLKVDPDNASALNYLGYMLADRNVQLDHAHELIQKALDLDPNNGAYLDSLGWLYYRQDKLELAERHLLRSLKQYKHDPIVLSHLGDVYHKLGKVDKAKHHWERSLQEWQRSPKADQDPSEISSLEKKLGQLKLTSSGALFSKEKGQ